MNNNLDSNEWDFLLNSIELSSAVLLLGHNVLQGTQEELYVKLRDKLGDDLQHFYARDGLFLFRDGVAKARAQQEAALLYKSKSPDEAVLKKIVQLPFHVMISANPDQSICAAFARYRQRLQFDYFSSKNKINQEAIVRPTRENPLLYNLCGSHEDQESLLLDYDDLFGMLKQLLPDLGIPDSLRGPLKKCNTYIFVGFHFERWYTQLFLKYLNMNESRFENSKSNYVLKTVFQHDEAQRFFLEQFNVKFIGADLHFLEELHRRFAEKFPDGMRKIVDELSPAATAVHQLVARGDVAGALAMMNIYRTQLDEADQQMLTMTEAAHSQYLSDKGSGQVLTENLNISLAKVRNNLLALAAKIK